MEIGKELQQLVAKRDEEHNAEIYKDGQQLQEAKERSPREISEKEQGIFF